MVWTGQYRHALIRLKFSRPEDVDCETVEREIVARTQIIQEIEEIEWDFETAGQTVAPRSDERLQLITEVTDLNALAQEKQCPDR